jgi:hypothetical protein
MAELSEADKKSILGATYQPPKAQPAGTPAKRTWSERLKGLFRK